MSLNKQMQVKDVVPGYYNRYNCIEFTDRLREARFIKVKNRQVKKFNGLVNKSREKASTHSSNNGTNNNNSNSNQVQALDTSTSSNNCTLKKPMINGSSIYPKFP